VISTIVGVMISLISCYLHFFVTTLWLFSWNTWVRNDRRFKHQSSLISVDSRHSWVM